MPGAGVVGMDLPQNQKQSSHTSAALNPQDSGLADLSENSSFLPGPAASTAKGVLDGQGGRQLGRLEAMLTSVSHFNSNLKFISNTRDSSLSHSLLLFFSTDILIWMWLAGSKL